MVFGSTYCTISHLEIKDGDKCILIPLGFRMQHEFDEHNKADINCFTYLHVFLAKESVEVKYCGNISEVKYIKSNGRQKKGNLYEEHELFMLVNYDFYQKIINEFFNEPGVYATISMLPLFNTSALLYEKAQEISNDERSKLMMQKNATTSEKETESFLSKYINIPTPEWLINIYKVAQFMGKMGIAPHPAFCSDQHQTGKLYEKFRNDCLKKKTNSKK